MRSMTARFTITGTTANIVLCPNGARLNTVSGTTATDAWLGSCLLTGIAVTYDSQGSGATSGSGATARLNLTAYDAIQGPSGGQPGRPLLGGTTTTDAFRCTVGGTVLVDEWGQPYQTSAGPGSQITNCRKVLDIPQSVKLWDRIEVPLDPIVFQAGCVIAASVTAGVANDILGLHLSYEPMSTGGQRRRSAGYRSDVLYHGTSTGTSATTLTDSAQTVPTFPPNILVGATIYSNGKTGVITSHTGTVFTVASWVGGTPASANAYFIKPVSKATMSGVLE